MPPMADHGPPEYPVAEGDEVQDGETRDVMERGRIVRMRPEAFLAITPAPPWWEGKNESYERVKGRIERGEPVDIPYLRVFYKHLTHEGRHRALAAKDAGLPEIPVAVLCEAPSEAELEYIAEIQAENG